MSKQREKHRGGLIAGAVFAALLLIAGTASAASDTTQPFGPATQPNPCNGDSVTFQGTERFVTNNHVDSDGTMHVNTMHQIKGQGVGSPSGVQYNVGSATKVNGKFPPGPVIFRERTKVISNGPTDNFYETFFFRINQDGSPGNTNFQSDCRG